MVILIVQQPDIHAQAAQVAAQALQHVVTDHAELPGGDGGRVA